jgi:hypothetical protein
MTCDTSTHTCTTSCGAGNPCNNGCCATNTCVPDCSMASQGHLCQMLLGVGYCSCNTNTDCATGTTCGLTSHQCQ